MPELTCGKCPLRCGETGKDCHIALVSYAYKDTRCPSPSSFAYFIRSLVMSPELVPDAVKWEIAEAFVQNVNAEAEAAMLMGKGISGAHHRAIESVLAAMREEANRDS